MKAGIQMLGKNKVKDLSLLIDNKFFINNRDDMEMMLNKIVPEGLPYRHSCEGPDDMVSV